MTLTTPRPPKVKVAQAAKRFGYAVAIAVNAALLYIAHHVLEWDVPTFLTDRWDELLPIITVSLVASIVVNATYMLYDAKWFKALTQFGLASISMVVAVRMYQVFPFEFSGDGFNWAPAMRGILVIVMIGIAIGLVSELVKFVAALRRIGEEQHDYPRGAHT
jgi:hypothetical protein